MTETLDPEDLISEGKKAYQEKNYDEAAQAFKAAAEAYEAKGDALLFAEMRNNLSVALLKLGESQAALQAVESTDLTFAQAGDLRRQAMALGNRGAALENLGRLEEALADYQQASDLFRSIGEHDLRVPILRSISDLQLRTGRQLESFGTMSTGYSEMKNPNRVQRFFKKLIDIPLKWFLRS